MKAQTAAGMRAPVSANKYLLPREVQVASVRQHPFVLLIPAAQAMGGITLGITLTAALPHRLPELLSLWTAVTLLVIHFLLSVARWSVDYFVITTERIIRPVGLVHRSVTTVPLEDLKRLTLVRTFVGRISGYGEFLNGSGRDAEVIQRFVPYPEQLYLLTAGMLYPSSADDNGAEDELLADFTDEI
jgi:hypothetical protein